MKTAKDYRDEFASLREKMEAVLEIAKKEDRDLNGDEKKKLAAWEAEMDQIEKDLDIQEKVEARIAAKVGARMAPSAGQAEPGPGNPHDVSFRAGVVKAMLETARTGQATTAKVNPAAVFQKRDLMLSDLASAGKALYKATAAGFDIQATSSTSFLGEFMIIPTRNYVSRPYVDRTNRITIQNKAESDLLSEQAYVISSNTVSLRNYYAYTVIHMNVLRDAATEDVVRVVSGLGEEDIALQMGGDALTGDGASNNIKGIKEYTGILTQDHASDRLNSYTPFVEAYKSLKANNVADNISVIMSPTSWKQLAELVDSTGQPLQMPRQLNNVRWYTTTLIPENLGAGTDETFIIMGDLSKVQLYVDEEISMNVDTMVSGHVGFKQDSVHIRQTWRGDIKMFEPDHLLVIENISTSALIL